MSKLRGRTVAELRVRGMQALEARLERLRLSPDSREPSDGAMLRRLDSSRLSRRMWTAEQLFAQFRLGRSAPFFDGFTDRALTLETLRRTWPHAERETVERADEIAQGRFHLFGWGGVECDPRGLDWHWDPRSGKHAPLSHWSTIKYLDCDLVGDSKVIWELNRHQYFVRLGQAYWLTGDEKYARTFLRHLLSWMDANPPKIGINWASSLEVALRAISWIWALHFFRESSELGPRVFLRTLKYLYVHARHLETYLSTFFSPNTHLTGEGLGLLYLGVSFPEFTRSRDWCVTGWRILREQLARQVRPDGVYFEQATHYHRYTTDFYIHAAILGQAGGLAARDSIDVPLRRLLDHLMHMTRPDGTTPFIGDDDGGQLLPLDGRPPNDFRDTLATGAVLLDRPDYAYVAGGPSQQTLWLLGPAGVHRFQELGTSTPHDMSRAFSHGGYFVMRDGWERESNFAVVDCGPHGALAGGHAHADALAIELVARGLLFLADAGTCTYTGSAEMRRYFRSTAAHNTVTVDGESSSVPTSTFRWAHTARSRLVAWITNERFDYFEGLHDGYTRLASPAIHRRSILFLKGEYWVIRDGIQSTGPHRIAVHFHCASGVSAEIEGDRSFILSRSDASDATTLCISAFAPALALTRANRSVSPSYGRWEPATECVFTTAGHGDQEVATFLLPSARRALPNRVIEIDARRGRAFSVITEEYVDTLLLGGPAGVEAGGIAANAQWVWMRRSQQDAPIEFVALAVRSIHVDGALIVRTHRVVRYVAGRLADGTWHLAFDREDHSTGTLNEERSARCAAFAE